MMKFFCLNALIACYILAFSDCTFSQPIDDWLSIYDSEIDHVDDDALKRAVARPRSGKRDEIEDLNELLAAISQNEDLYDELEEDSMNEREDFRPRSGKRNEDDRPRSGKRNVEERPRSGKREASRPRSGKREIERPRSGKREALRPRSGKRSEAKRPRSGKRSEMDRPRSGKRETRPRSGRRSETERPRSGKRAAMVRPRSGKREARPRSEKRAEVSRPRSGKRADLLNLIVDEIYSLERPRSGKREFESRPRSGKRDIAGNVIETEGEFDEFEDIDNDLWSSMRRSTTSLSDSKTSTDIANSKKEDANIEM